MPVRVNQLQLAVYHLNTFSKTIKLFGLETSQSQFEINCLIAYFDDLINHTKESIHDRN